MGDRKLLAVVAVVAIIVLVQPVHGQAASIPPLPVGLGFSHDSISPLSGGVPVYSEGDQLWFKSYATGAVNVTLSPPDAELGSGTSGLVSSDIPGNTSAYLLTFSNTDMPGEWSLTASTSSQQTRVQFFLVSGGSPVTLDGYDVTEVGQFMMNYTIGSDSAYDLSACTAGNQSTATAYIPVPASIGSGELLVSLNGTSVSVIPQGTMSPFKFWVGLSQDYAYQVNGSLAVLSRSMEVAQTEPVEVAGGLTGSFSTALDEELPMRIGEFTMSANFQGSQGTSVYDTSVLITGTGNWVWLQGCSNAANPLSDSVTVSASLQTGASAWPRTVYVLYKQLGVQLFSIAPVTVQPATVELVASHWGRPLTDSQILVTGVSQYAASNGTVFLAAMQYPVLLSVATPQTAPQEVEVMQPYSVAQVQVPSDQVVVETFSGGTALSGVVVTLEDSNGTVAVETSVDGVAAFYVPPANFTIVGTYGGATQSFELMMQKGVGAGQSLQVDLQFAAGGSDATLTYLLLGVLGIGVVFTGVVWAKVYGRLAGKGRVPAQASEKEIRSTLFEGA